ncbi:MAG: thioredoxin family protein [Neomegalonema sp.]
MRVPSMWTAPKPSLQKSIARLMGLALAGAVVLISTPDARAQNHADGLNAQERVARAGDLPAQLDAARAEGKHLVLLWETPNCDRCNSFHQLYLADPDFSEFVQERAVIVQINRQGANPVVDFDGAATTEAELSKKYAMGGAPTLQFLKETVSEGDIKDSEVMRQSGYREGDQHRTVLRAMFDYVAERGYQEKFFAQWFRDRQ